MPICKECGKDSFWSVDISSKICKECNKKKKSKIRKEKEILTQKLLEKEKSEKLNINNTGLSEKYGLLEKFKIIIYIVLLLNIGFIISLLKIYFLIPEQYRDYLQTPMIFSLMIFFLFSYIITMFFLYCIAKMTDFLFDLDKKTDNNV